MKAAATGAAAALFLLLLSCATQPRPAFPKPAAQAPQPDPNSRPVQPAAPESKLEKPLPPPLSEVSPPHSEVSPSHSEVSPSLSEVSAPHSEVSAPHSEVSPPHSGVSPSLSEAPAQGSVASSRVAAPRATSTTPRPPVLPNAGATIPVASRSASALEPIPTPKTRTPATRTGAQYLEAALADYRRESLPNGAVIAVKRQAGRSRAIVRIVIARDRTAGPDEAALEALLLSAEVAGPLARDGLSIRLLREDMGAWALELDCRVDSLGEALALLAGELASPSFSQADLDRALREARVAERRDSADLLLRALGELRAERATTPRGPLTREELAKVWSGSFAAERLSLAIVADAEPGSLSQAASASFAALRPRGGRQAPESAARMQSRFKALPLAFAPGLALIRGEFPSPALGSPDYAALTVAFAMLGDILAPEDEARGGLSRAQSLRLSLGFPYASITLARTADPAADKAVIDRAMEEVAAVSPDLGLDAYRARAITLWYSRAASSEGMAALIAKDLAAGGDGSALFRMSARIAEVKSEDVARAARRCLLEGPSSWVALGDPALLLGLKSEAFLRN